MTTTLTDLDELVLQCRNQKSKDCIAEAVASYKAGAFRAAIVATWIAVCFDYVEKLRDLALAGDVEAEKILGGLEKVRGTDDVGKALKFERELLDQARDKFELISHIEWVDLTRLRDDRNRCAHPSLVNEGQAYTPSAELARVHIYSAITHFLQHQPAQGKYALQRLLAEVDSEYFPTEPSKALVVLSSSPLKKARKSLVRNFAIVLLKSLLKEKQEYKNRLRKFAALKAVKKMYPAFFMETCIETLPTVIRTVGDGELNYCTELLTRLNDCWDYLTPDLHQRLVNYVIDLPAKHMEDVESLLTYPPLAKAADRRVSFASFKDINECFFFIVPEKVLDRVIVLFSNSSSYDEANEIAKFLSSNAADLSTGQINKILTEAHKNNQVLHCFELEAMIAKFKILKRMPDNEFELILKDNGLDMYAAPEPQDEDIPF